MTTSDAPSADPKYARATIDEQIEESERELRLRYGVYAKRVGSKHMTQEAADLGISRMRAIRDTLRMIRDHYEPVRAVIAGELRRKRDQAEHAAALEELKKHPAVAATLEVFPGANVGLPRENAPDLFQREPPPFDGHQPEEHAAA